METNSTERGVYHVSYGYYSTQKILENVSSDYTVLGEREAHMYDSIDIDRQDGERYTEKGKNVSDDSKPSRLKDVYFWILLAIVILLIISLVVIVYHLVVCSSEVGLCGLPNIPTHGSIVYITGTSFPASASFKCVDGFKLHGNSLTKCLANGRWTNGTVCIKKDSDCLDLLNDQNIREDGVYSITTWKSRQIAQVFCDMSTDKGGWTVFQHRFDGSVDFSRNFSEYENGFGNLSTEFWLGLRYIHEIASQEENELRIDLEAFNGTRAYETFSRFFLEQGPDYTLHVGKTIDSLHISDEKRFGSYHNGSKFSTIDHDADSKVGNCAEEFRGGWWYKHCLTANLNGIYMQAGTQDAKAMVYQSFLPYWTLKSSKIMMRRDTGIT